jgi:hypothetical protein
LVAERHEFVVEDDDVGSWLRFGDDDDDGDEDVFEAASLDKLAGQYRLLLV